MACVDISERVVIRVAHADEECDILLGGCVMINQVVDSGDDVCQADAHTDGGSQGGLQIRHEQSGTGSLAGNIRNGQHGLAILQWNYIVVIAGNLKAETTASRKQKPRRRRQFMRQESPLNSPSDLKLFFEPALFDSFFEQADILAGHSDLRCQGIQNPQFLRGIILSLRFHPQRKKTNKSSVNQKRYDYGNSVNL